MKVKIALLYPPRSQIAPFYSGGSAICDRGHYTIGMDFLSRILVVVYTFRDLVIRIISARKATARERKVYYEQNEE
jgi:hypothetical protein